MKKRIYLFAFMLVLGIQSRAQVLDLTILFLDANQDTLQIGGLESIYNTDSATAGTAFYRYYSPIQYGYASEYIYVDSAYSGDSISFYYQDCNGWHTFDTTFTFSQQLNVVIQTSCLNPPCDASFSHTIDALGNGYFAPVVPASSYYHYWDFGNGQNSNSPGSQNTQYTTPGTYLVIHYLYNNSVGCYDSVGHVITVYDSCNANFTYTMDSNTTVSFSGIKHPSSGGGRWYFGDGDTALGDSVTHTYAAKGYYYVSCVVYGAGCKDSVAKLVAVNPVKPYLDFTILFLDVNQDTMPTGGLLIVTNSDSASAGAAFYLQYLNPKPGFDIGHLAIDSSYQGDSVSFFYQDCNGWHTFDTIFVANQTLNVVIQTGCQPPPCDASFTGNIDTWRYGYFSPAAGSSVHSHYWDFGNGQTSLSSGNQITYYPTSGTYLVIHIISSTGCYDSSGMFVTVYDSCHADFTYTMDSNTTVDFFGIKYPSSSSLTHWSFGDGYGSNGDSVTHTYATKATYVVTYYVYGPGCSDSVSKTIDVNSAQWCDSRFSMYDVADFQKRFVRTDSTYGNSNWYVNNTLVSQNHSYLYTAPAGGSYNIKLVITDSSSTPTCDSSSTFYFSFCGKPYAAGWVAGQVTFNGSVRADYDSLKIFLISYDSALGLLTLVDSVILTNMDSGYYYLQICDPNQRMLVKAALLPGSSLYSSYIPTYYDSSLYWSGAINFYGYQNLTTANIDMIAGTNPGGPGFIGGYVTQGANKKDEPLDDIQILLLTDFGVPVASVFTHDGGRFEFNNLALGKYYLTVEIPGKMSATHFIILSEGHEEEDDRNFEVNSTYVGVLNATSLSETPDAVLRVFPNPATAALFIEWTSEADEILNIEFYALDGKMLKAVKVDRDDEIQSEIPIGDLPDGLYILRISGIQTISTLRLQKN